MRPPPRAMVATATAGERRRSATQMAMPTNTRASLPSADASFMIGVTSGRSSPDSQATRRWSTLCIAGHSTAGPVDSPAMTQTKATLKPYLAEIRDWVSQGMTDVWIAHRLNSTPASISAFRSQHGILRRDVPSRGAPADVPPPVIPPEADEPEPEVKPRRRSRGGRKKTGEADPRQRPVGRGDGEGGAKRRSRGGRGSGKRLPTFEAVLDTGDEGYGFWLDGAVRDDPVFAEHWASRRAIVVKIEARSDRDPARPTG